VSFHWYLRRARAMGPTEMARRTLDEIVKRQWRRRWQRAEPGDEILRSAVRFSAPLPASAAEGVLPTARQRLVAAADALLAGWWPIFGSIREDMRPAPDWFWDPSTGTRLAPGTYCFDIDIRRGVNPRSLKQLWELSRHHHTTVLAAAFHLTADERYAAAAADQLQSWWRANPFLSGPHWTSAIEVGIRLISWVWVRRLLEGWSGASALFEENPVFRRQLHQHQEYLATFPSYGTSANNHLVAEAAGQFAASCAFPWFEESPRWRAQASSALERQVQLQVFPEGLHREMASAYHAFVLELFLAAALEGDASGHPLSDSLWDVLRRMVDAAAAVLDVRLQPPRQGDDDEGQGLLVDAPDFKRWASLLATGELLFGRADWWPKVPADDVRSTLWTALASSRRLVVTGNRRPRLANAGMAILVADRGEQEELWCRLDHGPHGYLAIAAHAHADALAIELRAGGVEILADPGTYCYQGDPEWRAYFRSTLAHNTLEVDGLDQSVADGPFLWSRQARTCLEHLSGLDSGPVGEWRAVHDGYHRLQPPATHRRTVRLHRSQRLLEIHDQLETTGRHACRLTFHLGPEVSCELEGRRAMLAWSLNGATRGAVMTLPEELAWRCVEAAHRPRLGWYAPRFGVRLPARTLLGVGTLGRDELVVTVVRFLPTTGQGRPEGGTSG
jgi:hypothetical protein